MDYKSKYGDVTTPEYFVEEILDLLPINVWKNINYKWLDPGCGNGIFIKCVYKRLFNSLSTIIIDEFERRTHIITKMLYMIELNPIYIFELKQFFGEKANIYNINYILFNSEILFDVIIGNPPYNMDGSIKVPTNTSNNKKNDGKAIWKSFIKKSLHILNPNGFLNVCIPVIWMKPDKENMYNLFVQREIVKLKCFDNSESNKIFSYNAQTPVSIICLRNKLHSKKWQEILLYDKNYSNKFIKYKLNYFSPIPLKLCYIFSVLQQYVEKYGSLKSYITKTNMPPVGVSLVETKDNEHVYPNIHSCLIKNKTDPELSIYYSNKPLVYNGIEKIVLAHKMYGFPFYDKDGKYGISNRDNYVITNNNKCIFDFLSTSFCITLFESTRYRMKYLEKYIFELLPDISKIEDFPDIINTENICNYFKFNSDFASYYNKYNRFNF